MTPLRMMSEASELPETERYCTHCQQRLAKKIAWLELDTHTGVYTDDGSIPIERSQGWFPFGPACARKLMAKAV